VTMVKVGEHRYVNVRRRSLCDNCVAEVCFRRDERKNLRVVECDLFKPQFLAFKRCRQCASVYEVFSNFNALDFELCPECNERMKRGAP
jgi:hypothetical protein